GLTGHAATGARRQRRRAREERPVSRLRALGSGPDSPARSPTRDPGLEIHDPSPKPPATSPETSSRRPAWPAWPERAHAGRAAGAHVGPRTHTCPAGFPALRDGAPTPVDSTHPR